MFKLSLCLSLVVLQQQCFAFVSTINQRTRKSCSSKLYAEGFFASLYDMSKEAKGAKTVTTRLPVGNLFDSRDYIFECATNMRGYEWTMKESEELFDDLSNAALGKLGSSKEDYELGQIVLVPMEWDQGRFGLGKKYDVHDGQQRLVTLCLVLAALREAFRGEEGMEETTKELENMLNPPKVRKDDILRIQLRKRDNEMLQRILKVELNDMDIGKKLRNTQDMSLADTRVLENYGRLMFRAKSFTNKDRIEILDFLSERVHMLVCVPDTASIARNIVMSQGKGKDNEPIDDFKGLVCFRYTSEEDDMYETFDNWDKLASQLDVENDAVGRDIVSNACLLRASSVLGTKVSKNGQIFALESWLREELTKKSLNGNDFFAKCVKPASLALGRYRDLNFGEKTFSFSSSRAGKVGDMIAIRLTFLRALTSSVSSTKELEIVILELLVRSMGKASAKHMPLKELDSYLGHVERLALWMALLKPPASQRYQRCFKFLENIQSKNIGSSFSMLSEEEMSAIREKLLVCNFGLTAAGRKNVIALLQRLNSYILFSNDRITTSGGTVQLYAEPILPVKATNKMWGEQWPDKEEREFWMHRLGNFVLVSNKAKTIDSKLAFTSKKERYGKEVWPLTIDVTKSNEWSRLQLVEHMSSMLNLIDEIWGL